MAGALTPITDDGGVAAFALFAQTLVTASAFMFLTIGAKDVPSAEVSLYMLLELILGKGVEGKGGALLTDDEPLMIPLFAMKRDGFVVSWFCDFTVLVARHRLSRGVR